MPHDPSRSLLSRSIIARDGAFKLGRLTILSSAIIFAMTPTSALATETVTYSYDALGRLIRTQRTGGPAGGIDAQTQYDPAGNRSNVSVGGAASNAPPSRGVVVLPMNGYSMIVIGQ